MIEKTFKTLSGKGAGHNSNTDRPEIVNDLIDSFVEKLDRFAL
ncbi:hypothetical protein [Treponema medium]|uniref:Uncharacterized protein n=1 Tax=Treponema medium ATCC 700293 TaxID=1125700 RepID=A0AA87TE48_TREMD|nr:hypothetical protein [Treponema medium]EPF27870.1 hypothetical protein HMPREF9195_02000 [Treponema medium ATCC 700293]